MKEFNNIEEMKEFYNEETNTFKYDGNIELNFDLYCDWNIKAWDIKVKDMEVRDIKVCNIEAWNIKANNMEARNIKVWDIEANNIEANNIEAWNIEAWNISYFKYCIADHTLECTHIEGRRNNSIHTCLDSDIKYKKKQLTKEEFIAKYQDELYEKYLKENNEKL